MNRWSQYHCLDAIVVNFKREITLKTDIARCFMLKNNCCSSVQMFVRNFPRDVNYTMQTQVCINSCIHVKKIVIGFFYQVLRFQRKILLLFYWFSPYYSIFFNEFYAANFSEKVLPIFMECSGLIEFKIFLSIFCNNS